MDVPFKANDYDGNIHHLIAVYRDIDHANSRTPPTKVIDTSGNPVTCNPEVLNIGRYVLSDGTRLDSNDPHDPY